MKKYEIKNNVVMTPVRYNDIKENGFANVYDITSDWVCNYSTPVETAKAFKAYAQQFQSMAVSMYGDGDEYISMLEKLRNSCYLGEAYVNAIFQYNKGLGTCIPDASTYFSELKKLLNKKIWASIHSYDIEDIIEWKASIH